jgi:hypothetical protein
MTVVFPVSREPVLRTANRTPAQAAANLETSELLAAFHASESKTER